MDALTPRDIILHAANVVVLYVLLRLILWRPVERYLSARAERVRKELEDAAAAKRDAESLRAEYEKNLDSYEEQGREILREAQSRAAEQASALVESAKEQSNQLVTEARARAEEERTQAVSRARRDVMTLASEMAARILRREVSAEDDVSAALDFFSDTKPDDAP
ncbi:MAG: ATP synthase F0 subunit B [Oscillospiraceae bacterium]|jgi:F-type H+-transporting ATPase subunit b|nr:ATP synthase F0 subunit B [Oscillospiraceae bacterium]